MVAVSRLHVLRGACDPRLPSLVELHANKREGAGCSAFSWLFW